MSPAMLLFYKISCILGGILSEIGLRSSGRDD